MNLREAAQAVLDRWDSPRWKWNDAPTADLMNALRAALAEPERKPLADEAIALARFTALVAAHEREECARLCEQTDDGTPYNLTAECAAAIRGRT